MKKLLALFTYQGPRQYVGFPRTDDWFAWRPVWVRTRCRDCNALACYELRWLKWLKRTTSFWHKGTMPSHYGRERTTVYFYEP